MRVSLNRRLDRIRDHLLPPGSLAWRLDRLPDDLKLAYQIWRGAVDAINSEFKKQGVNLYSLLLAGDEATPPMPAAVYRALWPDGEEIGTITTDMTVSQAAAVYQQMLEQSGDAR